MVTKEKIKTLWETGVFFAFDLWEKMFCCIMT